MLNRTSLVLSALVLLWCATGCQTGSQAQKSPFPSRAEVAKIAAQNKPDVSFSKKRVSVEKWDLAGALPTMIGLQPRQPVSVWDNALISAVGQNNKHIVSEAASCIAREHGRFILAKQAFPHASLEQFINARCGAVSSSVTTSKIFDKTYDTAPTEENFFKGINASLDQTLKNMLAGNANRHMETGIWYGQEGNRIVIVVTRGLRALDFQPVPMKLNAQGKLIIRGKVLVPADVVYGIINRGDYGMGYCLTNPNIKLPAFEVECQGQLGDRFAAFRLSVARKKLIFSKPALTQMVWSATEPQVTFEASTIHKAVANAVENQGIASTSALPERLLKVINAVRQSRQLKPLTLSKSQSATAMKITPQFFNSKLTDKQTDKMFRGLIAGWDVKEAIVNGNFLTDMSGSTSLVDVVTSFLDSPGGRMMLFKRDSSILAVGAVEKYGQLGLVLLNYTKLKKVSHNRRVAVVVNSINEARKLKGLGAVQRMHSYNIDAEKAAKRLMKGESLKEVGNDFAGVFGRGINSQVYYFTMELSDLEDSSNFASFAVPKTLRMAVVVAPVKRSDHPWTTYKLIIAMPAVDMKK